MLEVIQLNAIAAVVFPFCRVAGFCSNMFLFAGRSLPMRARLLFAMAFTVCILPDVPAIKGAINLISIDGMLVVIKETLIGVALGYMTQFLAQVFTIAGQVVAMQTGLGFASLVDPVSGNNTPVVGQFFTVLTTLVFLAVNGHLLFFKLLTISFVTLPIGGSFLPLDGMREMVWFGSYMFLGGLTMALSALCTMLIINFTLGVMTRAAPQLNVFSLGFAVTMVTGLAVLAMSLNAYMSNFSNSFNEILERSCTLVGTSCEGIF
ncbi:MAG: flagellar biosynthetic protein FliR [Succinivibrio sp.]|nr:flagellar biosynthetic protein FliR [Succinivibrio sp.]